MVETHEQKQGKQSCPNKEALRKSSEHSITMKTVDLEKQAITL
jgi:hypothetical protein